MPEQNNKDTAELLLEKRGKNPNQPSWNRLSRLKADSCALWWWWRVQHSFCFAARCCPHLQLRSPSFHLSALVLCGIIYCAGDRRGDKYRKNEAFPWPAAQTGLGCQSLARPHTIWSVENGSFGETTSGARLGGRLGRWDSWWNRALGDLFADLSLEQCGALQQRWVIFYAALFC